MALLSYLFGLNGTYMTHVTLLMFVWSDAGVASRWRSSILQKRWSSAKTVAYHVSTLMKTRLLVCVDDDDDDDERCECMWMYVLMFLANSECDFHVFGKIPPILWFSIGTF